MFKWKNCEVNRLLKLVNLLSDHKIIQTNKLGTWFPHHNGRPQQLDGYTYQVLSPTLNFIRPHIANITSCHRIERRFEATGGNLAYIADPNWATIGIWEKQKSGVLAHELRTFPKTSLKDSEEINLDEYVSKIPNIISCFNMCEGYIIKGGLKQKRKAIFLSRVYGTRNYRGVTAFILFLKKKYGSTHDICVSYNHATEYVRNAADLKRLGGTVVGQEGDYLEFQYFDFTSDFTQNLKYEVDSRLEYIHRYPDIQAPFIVIDGHTTHTMFRNNAYMLFQSEEKIDEKIDPINLNVWKNYNDRRVLGCISPIKFETFFNTQGYYCVDCGTFLDINIGNFRNVDGEPNSKRCMNCHAIKYPPPKPKPMIEARNQLGYPADPNAGADIAAIRVDAARDAYLARIRNYALDVANPEAGAAIDYLVPRVYHPRVRLAPAQAVPEDNAPQVYDMALDYNGVIDQVVLDEFVGDEDEILDDED